MYFVIGQGNGGSDPNPVNNIGQDNVHIVRIENYGQNPEDVSYSPQLHFATSYYDLKFSPLATSIALSHTNPDEIWVSARKQDGPDVNTAFWHTDNWGTFTSTEGSSYWTPRNYDEAGEVRWRSLLLNPYYKLDGTFNSDARRDVQGQGPGRRRSL